MKTLFLLMAEFGSTTIPLEKVSKQYFSIANKSEADRKANRHELPIPTFKLGSQKSPHMVHVEDLAEYIDKVQSEQKEVWSRINSAC